MSYKTAYSYLFLFAGRSFDFSFSLAFMSASLETPSNHLVLPARHLLACAPILHYLWRLPAWYSMSHCTYNKQKDIPLELKFETSKCGITPLINVFLYSRVYERLELHETLNHLMQTTYYRFMFKSKICDVDCLYSFPASYIQHFLFKTRKWVSCS